MAVEGEWDDPKYQGFRKYFNSYTIRGRSNCAKAVLGFYALLTFKAVRYLGRRPLEEAPKKMVTDSVLATTPPLDTLESTSNVPIEDRSLCQDNSAAYASPEGKNTEVETIEEHCSDKD